MPEIDLDRQTVEWTTLDDGSEALLVNGGGIDGGNARAIQEEHRTHHGCGRLLPRERTNTDAVEPSSGWCRFGRKAVVLLERLLDPQCH
jgi:hypothetical protein